MARPIVFALIALIGLPAGYLARGAYEMPRDRAMAMISLFETRCLPLLADERPDFTGLVRLSGRLAQYADPQSALLVEWLPDHCRIDDSLLPLTAKDQSTLTAGVPRLAAARFPDLRKRTTQDSPQLRLLQWSKYPANPPAGVNFLYARAGESPAQVISSLELYVPRP